MVKRKNIWFYCPACEKKLVVGSEAGGFRADCPECGVNIPIPVRSTAFPSWVRKGAIMAGQAALLLAGIGVGWFLAFAPPAAVDDAAFTAKAVESNAAPESGTDAPDAQARASAEINRQLLDDHVELQGRYNKMVQWMLENYRGKFPLPERLVSRLRIQPLTDQGDVSPDLVEILRLSDQERVLVQDVITYVRENIQQAERSRVQVTDHGDHHITYSVPTFPEVGLELREDLFLTLETTLGSQRFDRLVDVAGESLREQLHFFGEAARTLTFEVIFPAVAGAHPPYLLIRDGWVVPEGESVRLTRVTETAVMRLPETYRAYEGWLPENLSHYATP